MRKNDQYDNTLIYLLLDVDTSIPIEAASLDPVFPEIEWIGVGDVVIVHGKQEDMLGIVKDTDPAEGKALVRSWSREVGVWYTYWWKLKNIELAATAGTTAA